MKRIPIFLTLFITFLLLSSQAYAQNPGLKLKRGAINVVTSPLEIPKQIKNYWKKGSEKTNNPTFWIMSGLVKGLANTACRIGSGLWDIVTFNLELPENYEPLMSPDYVFEEEVPSETTPPDK